MKKFKFINWLLVFAAIFCLSACSVFSDTDRLDKELPASSAGVTAIEEDKSYTSKDEVAAYIQKFSKLPGNFVTKSEAKKAGWDPGENYLSDVLPGFSIGGDRFGNYEELLPEADGRKWKECDINYKSGRRGAERIVYSNDGLIYYTGNHYKSFEELTGKD